MVSRVVNLTLRGLEFFFTLLIMALIGNIISDAASGNPSVINYDMFAAVVSMLSLIYLVAVAFHEGFTGHPLIPLTLDVLNTLFFFCGAAATAAKLGVHSCDNTGYLTSNGITNGATNMSQRCREAQASTAFFFFGFFCYLASTILSVLGGGAGVNLRSGGVRKGGPAMSQVA